MKHFKSMMCIAAALTTLSACHNHQDITPDQWLVELSDNPVSATAGINSYSLFTKAATATATSLENGFNVFATNIKNDAMWNYEFAYDGQGQWSNPGAKWVKAGKMTFRAVYPKNYTIGNDGSMTAENMASAMWPLECDPLVAITTSSPSEDAAAPVHFNFYHIASQIRMNVENQSDWDVRVHADLNSFYKSGTFTWKEPVKTSFSDGTSLLKLPASCWAQPSDDTDYCGSAVGNTAGSVAKPLTKGDSQQNLLVQNIVPVPVEAKTMTNPSGASYERAATHVKYTIYWTNDVNGNGKEDAGECMSFDVTKEITDLVPGVAYVFNLVINGDYEPQAMVSTATVDDFKTVTETIPVSPWAKTIYTVSLASSDAAMGSVEGAGEYKEGTSVTIKAVPETGYVFKRWSDGDTNAERTFTIGENMDLTALFAEKATYSALYVQFGNAWSVSNADKMTQGDDNHTWTKKLSVTEANKGWDGTIGFIIPTGTSYSAKVFNLDKNNPGHVVLLSSDQTYVYIPVETGDWILTLNDKTLEYTLTSQSSATDELTALIQWLEDPENDPNEYEYTEETLAAYNQALAAAKEAVQSGDYDTVTAAMATLREKYYALQTKGGSSTLPDLPGNM